MKKRMLSIIIMICFLLSGLSISVSAQGDGPRVIFDGEEINFLNPLIIKDGTTLAPLREIAEKAGLSVDWQDPEIVISDMENFKIYFTVQDSKVVVNGKEKYCPLAPEIIDGVTYVPLRFLCENLGFRVVYSQDDETINITQDVDSTVLTPKLMQTKTYFPIALSKYMPMDQNYVISPWAAKMLLSIAANGAVDETKQEILKGLNMPDLSAYNDSVRNIIQSYNKKRDVTIETGNTFWFNSDYYPNEDIRFKDDFSKTITDSYLAHGFLVTNEDAVSRINEWIFKQTQGEISGITDNAKFLSAFINTFSFDGRWKEPFDPNKTVKADFVDRNGKTSQVDFMMQISDERYYEDDSMQLIELPYQDDQISMYILLPKEGHLGYSLDAAFDRMQKETVLVSVPKFTTQFNADISAALKLFNIKEAFNGSSQFGNKMYDNLNDNLKLGRFLQKTSITVDEEGTKIASTSYVPQVSDSEASAATIFEANHPFVYMLRDNVSGEILFIGEYAFAQ